MNQKINDSPKIFIQLSPLTLSGVIHASVFTLGLVLFWKEKPSKTKVNIDVIQVSRSTKETPLEIKNPIAKPIQALPPQGRKVFGVSRKAILSSAATSDSGAPSVKLGNTLAKEPDNEKLNSSDEDQLPIPVDDYLISSMPKIESEFRINYPKEAKENNIEGPVVMDLLIDTEGVVREVTVISGPGYGLNEAASEALKKFRFRPARVNENAVPVKIRYTYKFILENR